MGFLDKMLKDTIKVAHQNNCTISINVVPTTGTHAYTIKFVETEAVSPAEAKRLAKIKAWSERAQARTTKWFEDEMVRIKADIVANAWRPRVSNSTTAHGLQLFYHTLGRASSDESYPKPGPTWKTYRSRYNKGWLGLSLSNISPFEQAAIDAFLKTIKKRDLLLTIPDQFDDEDKEIGTITNACHGFWFRHLVDHNRFVEMLSAIPSRSNRIRLNQAKLPKQVRDWLKGTNWCLHKGEQGTALTMEDSNNAVLVKMFYAD